MFVCTPVTIRNIIHVKMTSSMVFDLPSRLSFFVYNPLRQPVNCVPLYLARFHRRCSHASSLSSVVAIITEFCSPPLLRMGFFVFLSTSLLTSLGGCGGFSLIHVVLCTEHMLMNVLSNYVEVVKHRYLYVVFPTMCPNFKQQKYHI
ncbi:hypothetical protein CSKR_203679 [Clonorchis sinensis]|uniref:Uncharacterized protein n=1 Tax=Clonorchis sinensis TaxID=79923 RepID=A0A8T1MZ45_CLOSI|nr:hypothetical protein CSKR_203679 [Clonorchis sinensis]